MRVRNRLLILVLSVLVPAFLASALAVWYVYSEEQKAQEKGLTEAARAFALLVEKELQARESVLRTLANSPALARGDMTEFYAHAKSMAQTQETTIILADLDGRQLLNTRVPPGGALPARRSSNMAELIAQYGADRTLVSDVFLAPVSKRYDVTIQIPIKRDGEVRQFLIMGLNAAALQSVLREHRFPEQWLATILDRKGVVISRSRDPELFVGKAVRGYTRNALAAAREGVYYSVTLDGVPVKAFFSRIPISDWNVLISIPESEIRRVSTQATMFLGGIMVLLLSIAIVTARRAARRAIGPIEHLGATAERLWHGEEVSYSPQGLQEVDSVGVRMVDASRQIRRAKLDLEQRVADAVSATERAQRTLLQSQKLEALGRLTGGIAHEFNNLLQTLTTALQLAKATSDPARLASLIDTCTKAVNRASALTGQLGSFGRIQDARLATIDPGEQIRSFQELMKGTLPTNIAFELRLAEGLWPVTVDSLQLELALLNILVNARDSMPEGGTLVLRAGNQTMTRAPDDLPAGDYVKISISDSGSGMTLGVLAKALDPFFTTKSVGKGSGLGLPQAYGFARQSHGTLVLSSSEGKGTTVDIILPRATAPVPDQRSERRSPDASFTSASAQGTVLFVEDDPLVQESVVPALEAAGFKVHAVLSGDEALAALDAGVGADIVFSDIVMPGQVGGIELAGIIVQRYPAIRVILATGYTDQRVTIPGVELLSKPYDIADAVNILRGAAERT